MLICWGRGDCYRRLERGRPGGDCFVAPRWGLCCFPDLVGTGFAMMEEGDHWVLTEEEDLFVVWRLLRRAARGALELLAMTAMETRVLSWRNEGGGPGWTLIYFLLVTAYNASSMMSQLSLICCGVMISGGAMRRHSGAKRNQSVNRPLAIQ